MIQHEPRRVRRGIGSAASVIALIAGTMITLYCVRTIHDVAQIPDGDGTGMQWVVLTPLALLFLLIGAPALVVGLTGLRTPASPLEVQAARRTRSRALEVLFWVELTLLALPFLAPILFGLLMLLGVVD